MADVERFRVETVSEIVRSGPSDPGVTYWVTFDYLRVEIDSGNQTPVFYGCGAA